MVPELNYSLESYKGTPSPMGAANQYLIQGNEYYPLGMQTANSWSRENVTGNRYLANGGTEMNSTTGVYDLYFRNYDPALGRMNQVDPMASKYGSITPYNYSLNNPSNINDPLGDDVEPQPPEGREYFCAMCWREGNDLVNYMRVSGGGMYGSWSGGGFYGGGGPMGNYWHPGDGRMFWSGYESQARAKRWDQDAVRNGDMSQEAYFKKYPTASYGGGANGLRAALKEFGIKFKNRDPSLELLETEPGGLRPDGVVATCLKCAESFEKARKALIAIWNSDFVRAVVPDDIALEINVGSAVIVGGNTTYTMHLLTRGETPGLHFTSTFQVSKGLELINCGIGIGGYHFSPSLTEMKNSTLLGRTVTFSAGAGLGGNINLGYDSNNRVIWSGPSLGVGATLGFAYSDGFTISGWGPWFK